MTEAEQLFLSSHSIRNAALKESRDRRQVECQNDSDNESNLSQSRDAFWSNFRSGSKGIVTKLEAISHEEFLSSSQRHQSWDKLWKQFTLLQNKHTSDCESLPSADIRIFKEELGALEKKILVFRDNVICPRERFVFRRYHSWKKLCENENTDDTRETKTDEIISCEKKEEDTQNDSASKHEVNVLENKSNEIIFVDSETFNLDGDECFTLKNLIGCRITLTKSFVAIHMINLQKCTVKIQFPTSSSLHITKCHHSNIIAAAKQFRIHDSSHVNLHIHARSGPIIEYSNNITFFGDYERLTGVKEQLGHNEFRNVKDFNWLSVLKKSPNFVVMEEQSHYDIAPIECDNEKQDVDGKSSECDSEDEL